MEEKFCFLFKELNKIENKYLKENLAKTTNNLKILEKLIDDQDKYVRAGIGANNNTPNELLERLAFDKEWWVRKSIIDNKNINDKIINILALDSHSYIRAKIKNKFQ